MTLKQTVDTRKLIVLSLFCALAFTSTALFRIPVVLWLQYDPKDCLLAIGSMMYGPVSAVLMSVAISLVEMVTISDTGPIGMLMNVLSSLLFILPPAILYRRRRTLPRAIIGLAIGIVLTTAGMVLWNWLVTPLYTGWERAAVEKLLLPAFLPFNLFKSSLNAVLTMLLYKYVVSALRAARLVPKAETPVRRGISAGVLLSCLFLLASLILILLVWQGVL